MGWLPAMRSLPARHPPRATRHRRRCARHWPRARGGRRERRRGARCRRCRRRERGHACRSGQLHEPDVADRDGLVFRNGRVGGGRRVSGRARGYRLIPGDSAQRESASDVGARDIERADRNECIRDRPVRHRIENATHDMAEILDADNVRRRRTSVAKGKEQQHSQNGVPHPRSCTRSSSEVPRMKQAARSPPPSGPAATFVARCRRALVKTFTSHESVRARRHLPRCRGSGSTALHRPARPPRTGQAESNINARPMSAASSRPRRSPGVSPCDSI